MEELEAEKQNQRDMVRDMQRMKENDMQDVCINVRRAHYTAKYFNIYFIYRY